MVDILLKIRALIFGLTILSSFSAFSACQVWSYTSHYLYFGTVSVQRDAPVGTVLASASTSPTGLEDAWCPNTSPIYEYFYMIYQGGVSTSVYNTYKTNIDGVGIRGSGYRAYFTNPASAAGGFSSGTSFFDNYPAYFDLVKTGPISSGGALAGGTVATLGYGSSFYQRVESWDVRIGSGTITALTCSISTPNLVFPIGDVSTSKFGTSVGTIPSGAENTQNLGLNCTANANINATFGGTQNPDVGATSVLALTGQGSAGVASGVGVQILYNGSPLELNKNIVLKKSSGGQETFPLTARYYQTKTSVTTGTANASATLSVTYQ